MWAGAIIYYFVKDCYHIKDKCCISSCAYKCIKQLHTVELNLNFAHACRYTHVLACLTRAKLQKLACARIITCNFGVYKWDSKHMRHTRDARHELALGLPHYTCGVTTGTVAVGYEIQLLYS